MGEKIYTEKCLECEKKHNTKALILTMLVLIVFIIIMILGINQ